MMSDSAEAERCLAQEWSLWPYSENCHQNVAAIATEPPQTPTAAAMASVASNAIAVSVAGAAADASAAAAAAYSAV